MSQTLQRNTLGLACFILLIILAANTYAEDANWVNQEDTFDVTQEGAPDLTEDEALDVTQEEIPDVGRGSFKPKNGTYLIGSWIVGNAVGGDFDDQTFYTSDTAVYDVPSIDDGQGFAVALGGTSAGASFEISYMRTIHDTHSSFVDIGDQEAAFNAIDFNIKIHIIKEGRLRPYVLLGVGIPWITVENSMFEFGSYHDETFVGISGNLGGGLAYYVTPQVFVNAGVVYRWSSFGSIEGTSLDDNVGASGPSFSLGLGYVF